MTEITNQHHQTFESIRQQTDDGIDFWSARDLLPVLGYSRWDKFQSGNIESYKSV